MGRLVEKLSPYIDAPKKWHAEAVNITTNIKVKVDFTLLVKRNECRDVEMSCG